jgi:16S rRNA (cytidine1402-2'-O)-methyltransferase
MKPTLYIVATPIGNLGDMTYRAVETLKSADVIICEDTRQTKKLLNHYEVENKPLTHFNAHGTTDVARKILNKYSVHGSIVYVSDAGTPGISDPGYRLLQAALDLEIKMVPIPGASALTTLVSVAGVPVDKFQFLGFLPHKKGRQTIIKSLIEADKSTIFYESVHRFPRLLKELAEFVGLDRMMVVGRELTKMHEEIFRGTVGEALENFTDENTRGEFVVLVRGK